MSHYEPVKFLGSGKFSMVYEVTDTRSSAREARYAFKRVFLQEASSVRCILRESKILRRLAASETQSPFVTTLLHSFRFKNSVVFIETLASESTLKDLIKRVNWIGDENAIRFYLSEIMCGLLHLHNNSIVHGDVKPSNILLTYAGHILISDMDCSFDLTEGTPSQGDFCGTPVFYPPEVAVSSNITPKSDVWSLGVTLAYMRFGYKAHINSYVAGPRHCLKAKHWMRATNWQRVSRDLRDVFVACLTMDSNIRPTIEGLKGMHFFDNVSWSDVEACKLTPPYPPTSRQAVFRTNRLVLEAAHGEGLVKLPKSPFFNVSKDDEGAQALEVLPPVDLKASGWTEERLDAFLNRFEFVNPNSGK